MSGCFRRDQVVLQGDRIEGAARVGTNKKIPVVIDGSDAMEKKDVGGYFLVPPNELKALIDAAKAPKAK